MNPIIIEKLNKKIDTNFVISLLQKNRELASKLNSCMGQLKTNVKQNNKAGSKKAKDANEDIFNLDI